MALQADVTKLSLSDKIDRIVTNRYLALPIFALVMWLVYFLYSNDWNDGNGLDKRCSLWRMDSKWC